MKDDLTHEAIYERERLEQRAWRSARELGLSRRKFLQVAAATGLTAVLPSGLRTVPARADHSAVVKPTPTDQFIIHGSNREMRWEVMQGRGYTVPNELFFVRNHTKTPHVDPTTWRLRIDGSGVSNPIELTYDEILALPAVSERKFIECAGNGRSFFSTYNGQTASGTPWKLGAIGVAEWTGVRLSTLLERAGVKPTAVDVMPWGLDSLAVRRPIPIDKALADDTLLVYAMNGATLPEDHGFPARLLVPGWVGVANIKWVGRIEVSEEPLLSPWNTTTYRLFGGAYPDSPLLTNQLVKSAFELPWGATLPAGPRTLTGRSWSGAGLIKHVEVSVDGSTTWRRAELQRPNIPMAWTRWSTPWNPLPGEHRLRARATDDKGNRQPDSVPFNTQGYLYWAVVDHPITTV
jgi:sulfane dehydrogenase subunit SoxC